MALIKFLGTCGGRFATIFQTRSTGGIFLREESAALVIDPGPGALLRLHEEGLDPTELEGFLVSHCHIDHSNDAAIISEAITKGSTRRKGILIAAPSVIEGYGRSGPMIPKYYRTRLKRVFKARPGDVYHIKGLKVGCTRARHTDRTTVGFIFDTRHGQVGYVSDTEYFDDMPDIYNGCRVLIVCATRPLGARIHHHLCTEDVAELVSRVAPKLAVLTHFGLKTLKQGAEEEAEWIVERTGVKTLSATDSMELEIDEKIAVRR